MNEKKMTYSRAIQIIQDIDKLDPVDDALMIGEAIAKILSMTTINAVSKDELLNVVRFFFREYYEWEDTAPANTTEETKNGRLIDADALAKKVENAYKFAIGEVRQAYSFILDLIADAPTIPAPKPEDVKK